MSIGQERRIIAEASGTARRPYQRAVGARLDLFEMVVGPGHAQRGNEMRAALRWCVAPRSCSRRSIRAIATEKSLFGPAQRAEKIPGAPSSASTTSPESSAKAGNRAAFAAGDRLDPCIGAKAVAGFVGLAEAKLARRDRLDAVRRQQFAHLGKFAGIVGRDHELACDSAMHGFQSISLREPDHATAIFCKSTSRATPLRASAISARNSSCENGVFSAVPCTSMMRPSPVMTKLASVSASESSA